MAGHGTKTLTKEKSEKKVVAFGCILVISKWSNGFGFVIVYLRAYLQTRKHTQSIKELNGTVIMMLFDADSVRKCGIFLHKAVATYRESTCHYSLSGMFH